MSTSDNKPVSEELALLRSINQKVGEVSFKVDDIDAQMSKFKRQAALYGAGAGAVSGAIVTAGILAAKYKLGL
jgi:hypothetical protein